MSTVRHSLPPRMLTALLLVLAVVAAPHAMRLPLWLTAAVVAVGLWRAAIAWRGWAAPPRWALVGLTLALTAGVVAAYGTLLGLDPGVALVVAMAALKLLEMRRRRDTLVLIHLGYFLVITQFLYSQAIPAAGYMLAGVWGLTAVLIAVTRETGGDRPWAHGRLAALLVVQGLPLMIILFILFPRVSGPVWGLPERTTAVTGLSDHLAPGAISRLSRSGTVAFRAEFRDRPPPAGQRYWRGPVLTRYDGRTWRRDSGSRGATPEAVNRGRTVAYTVMLEPHYRRWLFALDLPAGAPGDGRLTRDLTPLAAERVRQLRRYRGRSYPDFRVQPELPAAARERYLGLPAGVHPEARRLGRKWRQAAEAPAEVVERAVGYFRRGGFRYTLTPPAPGKDWVDGFLFETRAGFCGHFAGSFAVLMRAAGIPARVVTGYLGGEMHPEGDYMIVRQSDAHAWAEVWLAGRGWVRVDPTTVVSPARADSGLGGSVPSGEPVPMMARPERGWIQAVRLQLDAAETAWNRWVLAYGPELQRRFLGRFGLGEWPRMVAAMAAGLVLAGGLVAAWVLLRRRPARDPAAAAFRRLERKAARAGLPRRSGEGPRDFGERLAAAFPERAGALRAITATYLRLRYARSAEAEDLARLRRGVRALRLPAAGEATEGGQRWLRIWPRP